MVFTLLSDSSGNIRAKHPCETLQTRFGCLNRKIIVQYKINSTLEENHSLA